jgi:TATA-box binding protein (TBP) (component of TFIID and TFIIIB)
MKISITQPKNPKKPISCRGGGKATGTDIDNDWTDFLMGCSMDGEKVQNEEHCANGAGHDHRSSVNNDNDKNEYSNGKSNGNDDETFEGVNGVKSENHGDECGDDYDDDGLSHVGDLNKVPKCSPIYISTKTKISFLNMPIDIKKVFWEIPIMSYASQSPGIIKKQIKFSCTTKEELDEIELLTQKEIDQRTSFVETQIIEHIDNPEGRIKFKDNRKINIGLSKKDILNCRCKKKRAFFNCFVLIVRVEDENSPADSRTFKEMHIKVFNTGKLEIPGIQHDDSLQNVVNILIRVLKSIVGEHIDYQKNKCDTVLINSNFNCGFYIDRDKLYNILKYKYRINSNYDSCSYPGIQCKFFYHIHKRSNNNNNNANDGSTLIQNGQQPITDLDEYIEISFMIFRTGSVLIVGKCEDYVLHDIYGFIKEMLHMEFLNIYSHIINTEDVVKKHVPKLRTRVIVNDVGSEKMETITA